MRNPSEDSHPLALAGFLPIWDVEKRSAPLSFIIEWTLHELRTMGHRVDDLGKLHQCLAPSEAPATARALSIASISPAFQWQLHRAIMDALGELPWQRIWIQTRAHYRILLPGDIVSPVPPHTDFGFGHQLVERNLWISLTDALGHAALHVHSLADSLAWMAATGQTHGVLASVPAPPPVPTRAGELLLFTPLHIHGARTPNENQCRVSIDIRIVPRSERPEFTFTSFLGVDQ